MVKDDRMTPYSSAYPNPPNPMPANGGSSSVAKARFAGLSLGALLANDRGDPDAVVIHNCFLIRANAITLSLTSAHIVHVTTDSFLRIIPRRSQRTLIPIDEVTKVSFTQRLNIMAMLLGIGFVLIGTHYASAEPLQAIVAFIASVWCFLRLRMSRLQLTLENGDVRSIHAPTIEGMKLQSVANRIQERLFVLRPELGQQEAIDLAMVREHLQHVLSQDPTRLQSDDTDTALVSGTDEDLSHRPEISTIANLVEELPDPPERFHDP